MAIQELKIDGFRSLKSATWRPRALNLVVGPNGSGKSNLLRTLDLISAAARGELRKTIDSQGGIARILWDYRPGSLQWHITVDPVFSKKREIDALTYECEISQIGKSSSYSIHSEKLANYFEVKTGKAKIPKWVYTRGPDGALLFDQKHQRILALRASFEEVNWAESFLPQFSEFAGGRNKVPGRLKQFLGNWAIHHNLHVDSDYSGIRLATTTQHTTTLESDGHNLTPFLHTLYLTNRDFQQSIDEGMRAGFGTEYESLKFPPAAASQIELAVQWRSSSKPHVASDLSDGTLRFLLLLAILANPDPPSLIVIDEPENGLHPSMLPIIAEYAVAASEKTQIVMTSHSPEFLDVFTNYSPHVTVCHWEAGQTHLFELADEKLSKWLTAYRLGQLFTSRELEILALPDEPTDSNARKPSRKSSVG